MLNYEIKANEEFKSTEILFDGKPSEAVREKLKANGYRWHKIKGVWYGYLSAEEVKNLLDGGEVIAGKKVDDSDKQEQSKLMAEFLEEIRKHEGENWVDYHKKNTARIYKTADGKLIPLEKPRIETHFCFGYSDSAYDTEDYDRANEMAHHARTQEDYFLSENRDKIGSKIKSLENNDDYSTLKHFIFNQSHQGKKVYGLTSFYLGRWFDMNEKDKAFYQPLEEVDRLGLIEAYKKVLEDFEKRLQTYLKRYGLKNIKSWSYWRDA